jgi:hypothetical protein
MSEEKQEQENQEPREAAAAGDADEDQDRNRDQNQEDSDEETEEEQPRITLDRYLSKRHPPARSSISTLVAAALMLVTLILIVIYKDRCGSAVSNLMGDLKSQETSTTPPVRVEIKKSGKTTK